MLRLNLLNRRDRYTSCGLPLLACILAVFLAVPLAFADDEEKAKAETPPPPMLSKYALEKLAIDLENQRGVVDYLRYSVENGHTIDQIIEDVAIVRYKQETSKDGAEQLVEKKSAERLDRKTERYDDLAKKNNTQHKVKVHDTEIGGRVGSWDDTFEMLDSQEKSKIKTQRNICRQQLIAIWSGCANIELNKLLDSAYRKLGVLERRWENSASDKDDAIRESHAIGKDTSVLLAWNYIREFCHTEAKREKRMKSLKNAH
ncbi:MAG: hypothetical protein LBT89_03305 [Planctomycetaceae bacterium]|jgi:hypothetical protein|nr:hypothetical protein [Planctomycetaceae bacterium]